MTAGQISAVRRVLLIATGILYAVAMRLERLGALLLAAAWSLMVLWTSIALGPVA